MPVVARTVRRLSSATRPKRGKVPDLRELLARRLVDDHPAASFTDERFLAARDAVGAPLLADGWCSGHGGGDTFDDGNWDVTDNYLPTAPRFAHGFPITSVDASFSSILTVRIAVYAKWPSDQDEDEDYIDFSDDYELREGLNYASASLLDLADPGAWALDTYRTLNVLDP